ncbi:uncharacterized protein TRUGW13939_08507 [Talaromyces rugulosus]|uniref:BZIP domain-containing protein n=1 Tax=Talaromyces rugulosus TaxID=121627 RepID=A0A7H8R4P6_TALRU|nr:uncharacterized protein TRUGW13939_08507 [Talaromyces rugulosus]QKX61359.1 hypothetical protein TRUGW13939_08507 [Talaromyces rugulosus]
MSSPKRRETTTIDQGRKRERDRENQRRKRLKERETILGLQNENRNLQQQVRILSQSSTSSEDARHLSDKLREITSENEALKKHVTVVNEFMASSDKVILPLTGITDTKTLSIMFCDGSEQSSNSNSNPRPDTEKASYNNAENSYSQAGRDLLSSSSPSSSREYSTESFTDLSLSNVLSLAEWQRLPVQINTHDCGKPLDFAIRQVRDQSDFAKFCTPYPKVVDLMLGGSLNELANTFFRITSQSVMRRPERLAISWNSYLFSRWTIDPSQENYSRVPPALKPTMMQLLFPHANLIDYIMWPQVRDNLIKHGSKYWQNEVFGLLFCTCRIRGTHNTNFPSFESEDEAFRIDVSLLERASNVHNWVILEAFWKEFPELVEGLDPKAFMITEKDLL